MEASRGLQTPPHSSLGLELYIVKPGAPFPELCTLCLESWCLAVCSHRSPSDLSTSVMPAGSIGPGLGSPLKPVDSSSLRTLAVLPASWQQMGPELSLLSTRCSPAVTPAVHLSIIGSLIHRCGSCRDWPERQGKKHLEFIKITRLL